MKYFAYGSNMSVKRMKKRAPSAKKVCVASLHEHVLTFHKVSKDKSGKCDALLTRNSSDVVYGVIYDISRQDKLALDSVEGRRYGYEMKWTWVMDAYGRIQKVFTYYATDIDIDIIPYSYYKAMVLKAAAKFKFPKWYVREIASVKSKKRPVKKVVKPLPPSMWNLMGPNEMLDFSNPSCLRDAYPV